MTKKIARTHCRASASRTWTVVVDRGPSSNVRITSCESSGRVEAKGLPTRGVVFASIASTRLVPRTPGAQSAALVAEGTRPQIAANAQNIRQAAIYRFPDDL